MRNAKNSKNNVFNCIFCVKIGTGNNFDLNLHLSHGGTILDILTHFWHFYVLFLSRFVVCCFRLFGVFLDFLIAFVLFVRLFFVVLGNVRWLSLLNTYFVVRCLSLAL